MQNPTFELIAIRIRRWSLVNESAAALYSVRTPTTSLIPKSGTAMPERSMLTFVGSFRYPGSTEGLSLMIGLPLDATQPESPCPMGISSAENKRQPSPATSCGYSLPSCRTYAAIESYG